MHVHMIMILFLFSIMTIK